MSEGSGTPRVTVVIPARNSERTIGHVLSALAAQDSPPDEVVVVDDGSTDATARIARAHGVRVVRPPRAGSAGGARNAGWEAASGDLVCFLDSDAIPSPGWGSGLRRAAAEFPGAIIGCARTFEPEAPWGWVAYLQFETPYLPRGAPRVARFVSSFCMAVPADATLRFDESYGGEDGIFCADATARGISLVFDPRFSALHDHGRETFEGLRQQQRRLAFGLARIGRLEGQGLRRRVGSRFPLHYFLLIRLVAIGRRTRGFPEHRSRFLRLLPRLVVAEWLLGLSALRYALKRPELRTRAEHRDASHSGGAPLAGSARRNHNATCAPS